jgi:hypothetical protein
MIHWTDHMIVRANPPRVNEPVHGALYWFSTSTEALFQARFDAQNRTHMFVQREPGGSNSILRRSETTIYEQHPSALARMGITRPY